MSTPETFQTTPENVTELHQRFPLLNQLDNNNFTAVHRAYADVLAGLRADLDQLESDMPDGASKH